MADPLWINADAGAPAYAAAELRQAMALALMYDGANLGARGGVRPGGNQLLVSLDASTITVQPGLCCLSPNLTTVQGPYWVALPTAETHTLTPADATNPRKDKVVIRVYDHDEDASGLRLARTEYLVGTPSPTPVAPATPAGSLRLAEIDVPQVGGGSAVVTDVRRYMVASGGITPTNFNGEFTAGVEGRYRDRLDLNTLERDSGSTWETVADPAVFTDWLTFNPTWSATTAPNVGNGVLTGRYKKIGRVVHLSIKLNFGSTTTPGTGRWSFGNLPATIYPAMSNTPLNGHCYDSSPINQYPAAALLSNTTGDVLRVSAHGSTGTLGAAESVFPFTWATGDELFITGVYQSAS